MYAIIKTGGKQYRVAKGDIIDIELLKQETNTQVEFNEVLFVKNGDAAELGTPSVSDCSVIGEIIGESAGPKVVSLKYKPRQHRQKKWGHRQHYTRVKIIDISNGKKTKTVKTEEAGEKVVQAKPKKAPAKTAKVEKEEAVTKAKQPKEKKEIKKAVPKAKKTTVKAAKAEKKVTKKKESK